MIKNVKLGYLETKLIFTLEEKGKRIFKFSDAKEILGTSDSSVANVLKRLEDKKRITEIEKGKFILSPAKSGLAGYWTEDSFLVVDSLLVDYYVGFWSAMRHWDMTEQIPQTLFVVTTRQKKDIEYSGQKIKFVTIKKDRFYGYIKEKIDEGSFKISDKEKTIVDCLTHPEYSGGIEEVTKAIWNSYKDLDWKRILDYLNRLNVSAVTRRLGYLLDVLEIKRDVRNKLAHPFSGYRWLDPSSEKKLENYSKEWGLKVNLTDEKLLEWRGH